MKSYIKQLIEMLDSINSDFSEFMDNVEIHEFQNDSLLNTMIITPPYFFTKPISKQQTVRQLKLLEKYSEWEEHFNLLTRNAANDTKREINECEKAIRKLINLESDWGTAATGKDNYSIIAERFTKFRKILSIYETVEEVCLIPDTNALIIDPELSLYEKIAQGKCLIIINSIVLAELDKLKIVRRDDSFRERIESIIRRIKGLRNQGSLLQGVKCGDNITVQMPAKEPDFSATLSWIDPTNNDDRIIAFVLEYQRMHPSQLVILVTSDINLQNKSEMARIPFSEPPSKINGT